MAGKNEDDFKQLARWLGAYSEKSPDMGKCWKCGSPRFQPKTSTDDHREVKASRVDYLLGWGDRYAWVECKSGEDSFAWADEAGLGIRAGQRVWMNDYTERGVSCWIFLTLGRGAAPKKRESWLIYWPAWLMVEAQLRDREMLSIPWHENQRHNSRDLNVQKCFKEYQLLWEARTGWTLPDHHPLRAKLSPEIKYTLPNSNKETHDDRSTNLACLFQS